MPCHVPPAVVQLLCVYTNVHPPFRQHAPEGGAGVGDGPGDVVGGSVYGDPQGVPRPPKVPEQVVGIDV